MMGQKNTKSYDVFFILCCIGGEKERVTILNKEYFCNMITILCRGGENEEGGWSEAKKSVT